MMALHFDQKCGISYKKFQIKGKIDCLGIHKQVNKKKLR